MKTYRLLLIFSLLIVSHTLVLAQVTVGPNNPATAVNSASAGTVAWTNPTRSFSSNNSYSTATNGVSNFLNVSNFGFAIPTSSSITGILVEVERKAAPVAAVAANTWVTRNAANYSGSSNATTTYGTTTHTYTLPNPAGANRMMVVTIGIENTDLVAAPQDPSVTITGVTYNGIAMTLGVTNYMAGTATGNRVAIYYLLEAQLATLTAGTTYNLRVTKNFPGDAAGITPNEYVEIVGINTYTNVNQTTPVSAVSATSATSPISTANLTNLRGGDFVIAATINNTPTGSITPATGYTENFDVVDSNTGSGGNVGAIFEVQSKSIATGTTTETPTATATGHSRLVMCAIAVLSARVYDNSVMLMNSSGVTIGNNLALTPANSIPNAWPDTDTYTVSPYYGSLTELWGATWTPAIINNSNFGVSIQADARNSIASIDHIRVTIRYTVILQATLQTFEVVATKEGALSTFRVVTDDYQPYTYTLEKSKHGYDFEKVTDLSIHGVNGLQTFTLLDKNPFKGLSYYRLRIDEIQDIKYSRLVSFRAGEEPLEYLIYPNPFQQKFYIRANKELATITVFDMLGQYVQVSIKQTDAYLYEVILPAGQASGMYVATMCTGIETFVQQLVVN